MPDVEHSGCGCWCGAQENDVLVDADGVEDRALPADQVAHLGAQDPLRLRVLCAETVDAGHSVLLFCGAKKARPPRDPFCHWAAHACLSIVSLGQVFLALLPRRRALLAPRHSFFHWAAHACLSKMSLRRCSCTISVCIYSIENMLTSIGLASPLN